MQRWTRWLRPGRALVVGLALLALSVLLALTLSAVTANAAPPPAPDPVPSGGPTLPGPENPLNPTPLIPAPDPSADPEDSPIIRDGIEESRKEEAAARAEFEEKVEQYKKDRALTGGVLSAFEVTDRDGNPVSSYRIYADTGDWNDWNLGAAQFMVELLFLGNKWLVSFACFLISWSLSFSLANLLLRPALTVSTSLYSGAIVQMGLPTLFLTFALVVASWHLMFGSRVRGWGEMAAALVISALAAGALASPPQFLLGPDTGAVATVRALALETAALVLDKESVDSGGRTTTDAAWEKAPDGNTVGAQVRDTATALARPITDALVDAFVVRPAMYLSYGRTFDNPSKGGGPKCGTLFRDSRIEQAVFDQEMDEKLASDSKLAEKVPLIGGTLGSLVDGITAPADAIYKERASKKGPLAQFEKKCVKGNAASAKKASADKVGGAIFMLFAVFLTCAFIIMLSFGFLFAQVQIAIEAMLAKVALAIGVLPGPGRGWLWDRAAAIARALALLLASVLSLAVFIVVVNAVLDASDEELPGGLAVRFVVLDIICIGALIYRRRLARIHRTLATRARIRLGSSPLGGTFTASPAPDRRSGSGLGKALLIGGLTIGAMAATGGASSALSAGRVGTARAATRLGGHAARAGGHAVTRVANLTGQAVNVGATATAKAGAIGLKSTIGLPVYGPRAYQAASAAAAALPAQVTAVANAATQTVGRRALAVRQAALPAQNFVGEYRHNLRSLGRIVRGQPALGTYRPPLRIASPAPPIPPRSASPTPRLPARPARPPMPAGGTRPAAPVTPAPVAAPPRRRPAPTLAVQPPASAAQAMLQQRLHRIQQPRTTPPPTNTPAQATPPAAPKPLRPRPRVRGRTPQSPPPPPRQMPRPNVIVCRPSRPSPNPPDSP
ncbi:hypothetical protein AB0J03_32625 [Streptomyces microflavus]|uniref:hypothetical protein n=1 Tax=Streptomyces microflavus TaxID=1919 RepID=UPI0033C2A431